MQASMPSLHLCLRLFPIFSAHWLSILLVFRANVRIHLGVANNRMDPLSSLSVASSAIQIFDFSSKLWKQIRELYQSESGATLAQENVLSDAERLCSLNSGLSKLLAPENLQRMLTTTEENVVTLCNECDDAAENLVGALQELTLDRESNVGDSMNSCFGVCR